VSGFDIRSLCLLGLNEHDRDQWQANITDFSEQAVQCGLIEHRTG
jgi:hypothetical protein